MSAMSVDRLSFSVRASSSCFSMVVFISCEGVRVWRCYVYVVSGRRCGAIGLNESEA